MQTKFVEANGRRFEVMEEGTGDRLALCLHGFPEHAISWRHQIPVLVGMGYRVWAVNQRGYRSFWFSFIAAPLAAAAGGHHHGNLGDAELPGGEHPGMACNQPTILAHQRRRRPAPLLDARGYRGNLGVRVGAAFFAYGISRSIAQRSTLSAGHGL